MITGRNIERVSEGLGSDEGPGEGFFSGTASLKKELKGFPGAATHLGKKSFLREGGFLQVQVGFDIAGDQ